MPARVFVCLLTAGTGSLTSAELVRRLQVSPASVSKAVGYLETTGLIRRAKDTGRRERYVVDDDIWLRALVADTGAHAEVAAAARSGIEIFGPGTPAAARLERMARFFAWIGEQLNGLADAAAGDALTVVAALVHAARPLTMDDLAAALGWPARRAAAALDTLIRRPDLADPLAVEQAGRGAYVVAPRPDRLSPAQREALTAGQPASRSS
ncbi:MarR family transcriptional regulator [Nonomuraea sp. LP-02]|nr:MarR family transcriptional regulator [Nonomuraea sp. LP-02]MED7924396.1 MarR family transcriptional regulator [Nonomuraea sp. LP-02]